MHTLCYPAFSHAAPAAARLYPSHLPPLPYCRPPRPTLANRFIKWTQETFSAGGHKAELLPLLERCTRELQGGGRYASDIRYLRLWIQYVSGGVAGAGRCWWRWRRWGGAL
jgi:hypothetical protein